MTPLDRILAALADAGQLKTAPEAVPSITGLADDSRRVAPGMLFCAVEGSTQDGHQFLGDAVRRGAVAALVTRPNGIPVPHAVVRDSRIAAAIAAAVWYERPGDALRLVGVTGTNGKSTTVALARHLLKADGTVGSVGTLGAFDGAGAVCGAGALLTTPGPVELQGTLAALRARGARTVVMEASSHALDQDRLFGLRFTAAVFTNLTHDHLDYHQDLHSYLAAKLSLADLVTAHGTIVTNVDDSAWEALGGRAHRYVTYGAGAPADVRGFNIRLGPTGTTLDLAFGAIRVPARLPLLGSFNVSNALAAAATVWALEEEPTVIAARLATAPQVPGRMERLAGNGFVVLRDYAHTPDALARLIESLRPLTTGRLLVLFGCGGDRDRRKRPVMGRIAARGADLAIVTSDNPRTEDPERIIDEIEEGMTGVAHLRIADRREAIARALAMLEPGDCLVLAGKGHETYQVVGAERLPMDERQIVQDALSVPRPS